MLLAFVCMFLSALPLTNPQTGFDKRETEIINSTDHLSPLLRLYLVNDSDDMAILRKVCDEVDASIIKTDEYVRLLQRMLATVTDPDNTGVGIAAPQVGITKRIILVQRFDREGEIFGFYINPKIVEASQEMVQSPEGCLSVPDCRGYVMRHKSITIEYNHHIDFRLCREKIEGFTSIIFQHEIDHLDGILYTDKLINPDGEN